MEENIMPQGPYTLALCQDCRGVFRTTHQRIAEADERNRNGNRLCPNCGGDLCACPACVRDAFLDLQDEPSELE